MFLKRSPFTQHGILCLAPNAVLLMSLSWVFNLKYIKFNLIPAFLRCFKGCKLRLQTLLGQVTNRNLTFIWIRIISRLSKANIELQRLSSSKLEAMNWLPAGVKQESLLFLYGLPWGSHCSIWCTRTKGRFTPSTNKLLE